jgi:DNA-binding MarR family transcriptional regulator
VYELSDSLIELRLATRRACMCESDNGAKKNTLSLKTKVLFLIAKNYNSREILTTLLIAKTNLALLTREMANEGLIEKTKGEIDRREVCYTLTQKGASYLNERKKSIEESLSFLSANDESYEKAIALIEKAILLMDGKIPD